MPCLAYQSWVTGWFLLARSGWCLWPGNSTRRFFSAVLAWIVLTGGLGRLLEVRWPLHLLRGLLAIGMLASFAWALRHLPLGDAYAIFFVAPLLILLTMGMMEVGRMVMVKQLMVNASREGARRAVLPAGLGDPRAARRAVPRFTMPPTAAMVLRGAAMVPRAAAALPRAAAVAAQASDQSDV